MGKWLWAGTLAAIAIVACIGVERGMGPWLLAILSGTIRWTWEIVKYGSALVLLLIGIVRLLQNKIIYPARVFKQPSKQPQDKPPGCMTPKDYGIEFDNLWLFTPDNVKLHGWLLRQPNAQQCPTLIFFHGNTGHAGTRLDLLSELFFKLKMNLLIVDYRGYGRSSGSPTEAGLAIDAEATFNYALHCPMIDTARLFVLGRSFGAAVVIQLALKHQAQILGIILENPFTSLDALFDEYCYLLKPLKKLILANHWPSIERIPDLTRPLLFIYSENDTTVSYSNTLALHRAAAVSVYKELYMVPGADHKTAFNVSPEQYCLCIQKFVQYVFAHHSLS